MTSLPPGMRVRDARPEDADALHALYHAAYSDANDPHRAPIAGLKDTLDDVRAYIRHGRVLVAVDEDGRIVATVALRRVANVRRLAVDPARQGERWASAMLEAVVDAARDEGFEVAMLDTAPDHPWLADFYRRHGFDDRCVEHFPNGERWLQLRRKFVP